MDFVLSNKVENVQRIGNTLHAAYNVFGLNDMKDMAKALKEVIKPKAHWFMICSALQFLL